VDCYYLVCIPVVEVGEVSVLAKRKTKAIVEFSDTIRERGKLRPIVMELSPYGMKVRLKGLRSSYEITPASVYTSAVLKFVNQKRAEKLAARKANRRSR
jgi:hypothetical protein